MAKKILIGISLDGDSEVKKKLQEIGEAGKRSLEGIDRNLGNARNAVGDITRVAGGLKNAITPIAEAGGLAGLLGGAGLGAALARFVTGPAGIAAGIASALVGMAKIGDETDRIKGRVAAAGDPKGFERLSDRAKKLGTDVASLAPSYENFLAIQQKLNASNTSVIHPPGFQPGAAQQAAEGVRVLSGGREITPPSKETFEKFDDALFTQIRRDTKSNEEARGITDEFKKSLFTGGLTPDLLRGLPPNARNFLTAQLSKPLGQGFENPEVLATAIERGRVQPSDLSATSVINAGAEPNAAFEKAAKESRSFGQKAEALKASIGRLGENAGGDVGGLGDLFDKGAQFIDSRNRPPPPLPGLTELLGRFFNRDTPLPERPGYTPFQFGGPAAPQQPAPPTEPVPVTFSDGRRYSRQLNPTQEGVGSEVRDAGTDLAAAIREAAVNVRNASGQPVEGKAGGGQISGPGTSKSDSVPIMGSNGEYVINADSAAKIGLANLDYMNATGKLPGVGQAAPQADVGRRYKSDFTGIFGGHVFDTPGSYAKGGMVGRGIPHFATGGLMDVPDMIGSAPQLSDLGSGSPWGDMTDLGITDLRTNHGPSRVVGPVNTLRDMQRAARDAADAQTGRRPSWMHGRG